MPLQMGSLCVLRSLHFPLAKGATTAAFNKPGHSIEAEVDFNLSPQEEDRIEAEWRDRERNKG